MTLAIKIDPIQKQKFLNIHQLHFMGFKEAKEQLETSAANNSAIQEIINALSKTTITVNKKVTGSTTQLNATLHLVREGIVAILECVTPQEALKKYQRSIESSLSRLCEAIDTQISNLTDCGDAPVSALNFPMTD
ncbi:hypothetical protein CROQUDRAFT_278802 [Cronartium quercuum f. sp. fusiforme G11]|uniref:Uncharacterized protein n=1 Tax=Cronartium quercuum f. sp. fusiforme G11 TaxID=708437 RepID=A0A9P6TGL6_9BASI|nr:hypothetical protein CROQUDRAFT_278802 [Cronartium quercuum f. sp. fusiforme G11]